MEGCPEEKQWAKAIPSLRLLTCYRMRISYSPSSWIRDLRCHTLWFLEIEKFWASVDALSLHNWSMMILVLRVLLLQLVLLNVGGGAAALQCPEAFWVFGDSLSDTGNSVAAAPAAKTFMLNHPYGESYTFKDKPGHNRFCDGRLVIDFIGITASLKPVSWSVCWSWWIAVFLILLRSSGLVLLQFAPGSPTNHANVRCTWNVSIHLLASSKDLA